MSSKTKTLVLCFSDLHRDPRVSRQLQFLEGKTELYTLGYTPPLTDVTTHFGVRRVQGTTVSKVKKGVKLLSRRFESYYWNLPYVKQAKKQLHGKRFDCIIANDIEALPLALDHSSHVVFDAHEYYPDEFSYLLKWRIFFQRYNTYLCDRYLPRAVSHSTVSPGLAREYEKNYRIAPTVITNAPFYSGLLPSKVDPEAIRMVYHGSLSPGRGFEVFLEAMKLLGPRFSLDILPVPGCEKYIQAYKTLAKNLPGIRFLPPIPMAELPSFCNQYDIGLLPPYPSSIQYDYCLPNKFFEYLHSCLAIALFPSQDMAEIASKEQFGILVAEKNGKALAEALQGLNAEKLFSLKQAAGVAAKHYSAGENQQPFLSLCAFS